MIPSVTSKSVSHERSHTSSSHCKSNDLQPQMGEHLAT